MMPALDLTVAGCAADQTERRQSPTSYPESGSHESSVRGGDNGPMEYWYGDDDREIEADERRTRGLCGDRQI